MPPEPRKRPPAPLVRRLLLHALEVRGHVHFALSVRLPARQLLAVFVEEDERGEVAAGGLVFDADFAGGRAGEVGERVGPVGVVGGGVADAVGGAVGV